MLLQTKEIRHDMIEKWRNRVEERNSLKIWNDGRSHTILPWNWVRMWVWICVRLLMRIRLRVQVGVACWGTTSDAVADSSTARFMGISLK